MKKFSFDLDPVLSYKQQVLDSLLSEHGALLAQVRQQEEVLARSERDYARHNAEFCERKASGITVGQALAAENGLRVLERDIQREADKLQTLRLAEENKRAEVVAARQDTQSLEKLREKKLTFYNKQVQKSDEAFIDEFVSAQRIIGGLN